MEKNLGQYIGTGNKIGENNVSINYYYRDFGEASSTPKLLYLFPEPSLYFHGREDKLSEIHRAVQVCKTESHSFLKTIVIQGFGGMGKSETARAYVYCVRKDYDYIVWFDSQTEISLNAGFENLAKILGESFKSTADVHKIYQKLTSTYKRGIFLFDNAEGLKSKDQKLGIEAYLHLDHLPNKPIFIVTSRNGNNAWDTFKTQIKIISLDRLSYDDTCQCVKKYLQIDKKTLPPNLEESICSIAKTLDGYPLALSLVSTTMGKLAEDINFEEIESRVNVYNNLLEFIPVKQIYDESDYEGRLNLIFQATTKELRGNKNGTTAIDLLAIMSHLDPDGITVELIYAIFSCKCYDGKQRLEIKDWDFSNAMKLLKDYSLVKVYKEEVKVHRLIQKSAKQLATNIPVTKILRFFEKNLVNTQLIGHMINVYNDLIGDTSVENKSYFLCVLAWNLKFHGHRHYIGIKLDSLQKCIPYSPGDERLILRLIQLYKDERIELNSEVYLELLTGMVGLSKEFLSNEWVLQCCIKVINEIQNFRNVFEDGRHLNKLEILRDLIVCNYTNIFNASQTIRGYGILSFLYGPRSTRRMQNDSEFLLKFAAYYDTFFYYSFPTVNRLLWRNALTLSEIFEDRNILAELVAACGVNIFTRSLQAVNQSQTSVSHHFLGCLVIVLKNQEISRGFSESKEFLNELSTASNWLNIRVLLLCSLHVVFIWVCLFVQDMDIYASFKGTFEREHERMLSLGWKDDYIFESIKEEVFNKLLVFKQKLKEYGHDPKLADDLHSYFKTNYEMCVLNGVNLKAKKIKS